MSEPVTCPLCGNPTAESLERMGFTVIACPCRAEEAKAVVDWYTAREKRLAAEERREKTDAPALLAEAARLRAWIKSKIS